MKVVVIRTTDGKYVGDIVEFIDDKIILSDDIFKPTSITYISDNQVKLSTSNYVIVVNQGVQK